MLLPEFKRSSPVWQANTLPHLNKSYLYRKAAFKLTTYLWSILYITPSFLIRPRISVKTTTQYQAVKCYSFWALDVTG